MITQYQVVVPFAPADVFAFLARVSNETGWRQSIVGSRYVGAELPEVGLPGETDVAMGSTSLTMRWVVTDVIPGEFVAWQLDGDPWNGGGSYRVSPHADGTTILAWLEVRLKGANRLFEPLLGLSFRRGLRGDLKRLARMLPDVLKPAA